MQYNRKYIKKYKSKITLDCNLQEAVTIGKNCVITDNCTLKNCNISDNVQITRSILEGAKVGQDSIIGPFARIRPSSVIGKNCKIGNFVEIKNSQIGNGTKINHLAYVGDASVGENCNIGCGVVFANFDGKQKNKIRIGNGTFIGSNCTLIAPLEIGADCFICAGSVVTESVPDNTFVIARKSQINKPDRAEFYLKGKKE